MNHINKHSYQNMC